MVNGHTQEMCENSHLSPTADGRKSPYDAVSRDVKMDFCFLPGFLKGILTPRGVRKLVSYDFSPTWVFTTLRGGNSRRESSALLSKASKKDSLEGQ